MYFSPSLKQPPLFKEILCVVEYYLHFVLQNFCSLSEFEFILEWPLSSALVFPIIEAFLTLTKIYVKGISWMYFTGVAWFVANLYRIVFYLLCLHLPDRFCSLPQLHAGTRRLPQLHDSISIWWVYFCIVYLIDWLWNALFFKCLYSLISNIKFQFFK